MMSFCSESTVPVGDWPGAQKKCLGFVFVAEADEAPTAPATAATRAATSAMRATARAGRIDLYLRTVVVRITPAGRCFLGWVCRGARLPNRLTSQSATV